MMASNVDFFIHILSYITVKKQILKSSQSVRKEIKCREDSEILHEIVHNTTRVSSRFLNFRTTNYSCTVVSQNPRYTHFPFNSTGSVETELDAGPHHAVWHCESSDEEQISCGAGSACLQAWDAAVLELHYQLCSPALTDVREHARHKVITPRGAKPCRLL